MNNIEIVKNYINECSLSIIKIKQGDNTPIGEWKKFQTRKLNEQEIFNRFSNDTELRIAVICGEISGNLEAIKIANTLGMAEDIFLQYKELPDVASILNKCVIEKAESGELHIYYRCSEISGKKQELALWPKVTKTNVYEPIIETCGEGAYVVCAPSVGYALVQGGFDKIPTISPDEREALISAARTFNKKVTEAKVPSDRKKYQAGTPYSLYNKSENAVKECENLLEKNGWKRNGSEYWLQPGKHEGISAINEGNRFRVVATNASPFESDKSYLPSSLYSLLKYGVEDSINAVDDFISMGLGELTKADICQVEDHLSSLYDFRLNIVTGILELKMKNAEAYKNAEDYDYSSIYREIQHKEINYSYDKLHNLLNSDFVPLYDPFKEYFEGLPKWDGTEYIKQLADTITLADDSKKDFWYLCLRRWLIALSGCATQENVTNEVSPVFYGIQGKGKTKWFNRLVPEALNPREYLFVGTINDDKDSKLYLSNKLLINLDELGSLNKEEIGYLKSLYTLTHVTLREPYMRKSRSMIRRASFAGSIDRQEFLTDLSGNRRFLAFEVTDVDYQHQVNMDMVYAQAYSLFKQGERFYFDEEEIREINRNNEDFRLKSFEEELFFRYFQKPDSPSHTLLLTTTEIAREFMERETSYKITDASIRKIGQLLSKNEFTRKNRCSGGNKLKAWEVQKVNQSFNLPMQHKTPLFEHN